MARFARLTTRRRILGPALCLAAIAGSGWRPVAAHAADTWTEVKSANLTVLANGSTGEARKLAWQLEQMRSALAGVLPWARVDLDRPFVVLAVDNEQKMRALLPGYWERPGGIRPASVWVTGMDGHYLAIRNDLNAEDRRNINPHVNAYFSYASLVIQQSLDRDMPFWFERGLAGILSNTIVRESSLSVGAPIPWHIQSVRDGTRLRLSELVAMTDDARALNGDALGQFDAQAWAFVHFLMFADQGARAPKLNQFFKLVATGTPADAALAEAIGKVEQLEADFIGYLRRSVFSYMQMALDASVKREGFAARTMTPAEAASALALFQTAMRRPVEARAAIEAARKGGGPAPDTYVAESLLLSREQKGDEARAALARAVAEGSSSAFAYYELARLEWRADAGHDALVAREQLLTRATTLNPRHARAFAMLGDTRALLGDVDAATAVARAVALEPAEFDHRLTAARVLFRLGRRAEALKTIEIAIALADGDDDRRRARELQQVIERQKPETDSNDGVTRAPV